jgi:UDP-glucose 4-epimerase
LSFVRDLSLAIVFLMSWLITGGAGYIGSHITRAMRAAGEQVVVLDDLSTGSVDRVGDAHLVVGSILDGDLLRRTMRSAGVRGIVHVAAKKQVAESVAKPLHYYRQNVEGLRVLLEAAVAHDVESLVFSSSAAVYGSPDVALVEEDHPCLPVNPYGATKLVGEQMIADVAAATGLRYANLRYFNVAGTGDPTLTDQGISNLVPLVFDRLSNRRSPQIYGGDYDTPDGTCIRDFIHVADVASAHVAAARALRSGEVTGLTANIGRGQGVSVREMVETIRRVTGTDQAAWAEPVVLPRRPGDPAQVVASSTRLQSVLGWRASEDTEQMVRSAWAGWVAMGRTAPAAAAVG